MLLKLLYHLKSEDIRNPPVFRKGDFLNIIMFDQISSAVICDMSSIEVFSESCYDLLKCVTERYAI